MRTRSLSLCLVLSASGAAALEIPVSIAGGRQATVDFDRPALITRVDGSQITLEQVSLGRGAVSGLKPMDDVGSSVALKDIAAIVPVGTPVPSVYADEYWTRGHGKRELFMAWRSVGPGCPLAFRVWARRYEGEKFQEGAALDFRAVDPAAPDLGIHRKVTVRVGKKTQTIAEFSNQITIASARTLSTKGAELAIDELTCALSDESSAAIKEFLTKVDSELRKKGFPKTPPPGARQVAPVP